MSVTDQGPGADAMPSVETGTQERGGLACPSAAASIRWRANIMRRAGSWHRVELAGAHETQTPVAMVKEPHNTIAIAALPEVLVEARVRLSHCTCQPTAVALDLVQGAIAALEGRTDAAH